MSCLLCVALAQTACAPMLSLIGTNQTLVQIVAQVERVKVVGDGATYVASSKTITDHALSAAIGKDCKVFNVLTRESVCTEKPAETKAGVAPEPAAVSPPQPKAQATLRNDMGHSAPSSELAGG
jgi:hypothetical protein